MENDPLDTVSRCGAFEPAGGRSPLPPGNGRAGIPLIAACSEFCGKSGLRGGGGATGGRLGSLLCDADDSGLASTGRGDVGRVAGVCGAGCTCVGDEIVVATGLPSERWGSDRGDSWRGVGASCFGSGRGSG